jgi:hypothetical protein
MRHSGSLPKSWECPLLADNSHCRHLQKRPLLQCTGGLEKGAFYIRHGYGASRSVLPRRCAGGTSHRLLWTLVAFLHAEATLVNLRECIFGTPSLSLSHTTSIACNTTDTNRPPRMNYQGKGSSLIFCTLDS